MKIEKKISRYLMKKYPMFREKVSKEDMVDFVRKSFNRIIYFLIDEEVVAVLIYAKVSKEALGLIKDRKLKVDSIEGFKKMLEMEGNNYHFICCAAEKGILTKGNLKRIIKDKNPDSVSWFSPDMKKLNIFTGR